MSDARTTGPGQVEVATAIMTAFGPIADAIVGVLLDRWLKKDRCNSPSDLELGLSSALKKVDSMRGRLDNLETSMK
jgi:hypothetical protein